MSEQEMREMDAWIAEMMEPKPLVQTLRSLREGKNWRYNVAETESRLGWWKCNIGFDGEKEDGLCVWKPAKDATKDRAAAMAVLERCADKDDCILLTKTKAGFRLSTQRGKHLVWSDPLPLAICLFARKLFEAK